MGKLSTRLEAFFGAKCKATGFFLELYRALPSQDVEVVHWWSFSNVEGMVDVINLGLCLYRTALMPVP